MAKKKSSKPKKTITKVKHRDTSMDKKVGVKQSRKRHEANAKRFPWL